MSTASTDIAVIGMAVTAPGVRDLDGYWDLIRSGRNVTGPFPPHRQRHIEHYVRFMRTAVLEPVPEQDVEFYPGSYLDDADDFDPTFFGMSPRQAALTDPHHRMAMRSMYLALEQAGYVGDRIRGAAAGIFVGFASNPGASYLDYLCRIDPSLSQLALTGNIPTMLANRLSHLLDLRGPSMVIDTACSAGLVAVHQAKNALRLGDCEIAVVAGARLVLAPVRHPLTRIGIEADDGITRTFDHRADGTGLGEGSGALVLKLLDRALADGDHIHAVIKGSAVNHDGSTEVITNPDAASQARLLGSAWADAGVDPRSIGYLEAHGTATRIGDPIEFEGLRRAFAPATEDRGFCAVGSVKANIGHLFEGSGVMGLIKAVLTLQHREIPPMANFEKPHPEINFTDSPLYVPTEVAPWHTSDSPRRAGVSGFGLGGTNAHVVLEEYVAPPPAPEPAGTARLFTLGAASPAALDLLVQHYREALDGGLLAGYRLVDVCWTSNVSRSTHPHRLALTVTSLADLADQLAGARPAPSAVAAAYLAGGGLPLHDLYAGDRPRIVPLPGYVFEERPCRVEFPASWRESFAPAAAATSHPDTHRVEFRPAPPAVPAADPARMIALVDPATDAEKLLTVAGPAGLTVLRLGEHFTPGAEGARELAERVAASGCTHLVHALGFEATPAADVAELDRRVQKNLIGLFELVKALMNAGVRLSLVSLTRRAIAEYEGDTTVVTENATAVGLIKTVTREYPYLKARAVDVDDAVPVRLLAAELTSAQGGVVLLRGDRRLHEVFEELPEVCDDPQRPYLRPGGTYLITGGTGALGLAVAGEFVREQPGINLVLASRSAGRWSATAGEQLRALASAGGEVLVQPADLGDPDSVRALFAAATRRFGRIDGVVHAAGIPGGNTMLFRDPDDFAAVIRPKVHGAFLIDALTRQDPPDFVVHFSSVAAVFPAPGQGDYAAANYYLDNLARAADPAGPHVLACDWVAWRDIGMAAVFGTNGDTMFRALPTEDGLRILTDGLRSRRARVFAGEVHYAGELIHLFAGYDVALADEVRANIDRAATALEERLAKAADRTRATIAAVAVTLTGRDEGGYSDLERTVARCFAHASGHAEIDIHADFIDMGGDSIMAAAVAGSIATCLGVPFDVADLLADRTVAEIADHIGYLADEA